MLGNKARTKEYRVGGTRGGADQFKWEDVKNDKFRENYLGHSVMAATGRWTKFKDPTWYAKSKSEEQIALDEEKQKLKERDEEIMNQMLGITKKRDKYNDDNSIKPDELMKVMSVKIERSEHDAERIKGLGAAPTKTHDQSERIPFWQKEIINNNNNDNDNHNSNELENNQINDDKNGESKKHKHEKHKKEKKHKHDKHEKKDKRERERSRSRDRYGDRNKDRDRSRSRDRHREKDRYHDRGK